MSDDIVVGYRVDGPLTLTRFQALAWRYAFYPEKGEGKWTEIAYAALGAAGEAGEIANKVKKMSRDDRQCVTPERRDALLKEAGDTMWYLAALCTELGADLSVVAQGTLERLEDRAERGVLEGSGDDR